jgi:hypothetical protein
MWISGLRHSAGQVGGLVFFGRTLDKIRLHAQGRLPADYNRGIGFDGRICRFLHIEYPALVDRALAGGSDEEIFGMVFRSRAEAKRGGDFHLQFVPDEARLA